MANTNLHYWQTLFRTKCIEVPFIWSVNAITLACITEGQGYQSFIYKPKEPNTTGQKKLVIFEPNISIMKWCFPSLLSCENAYRKDNNSIKQVFINNIADKKNGLNDFNIDNFNKIVNSLDLCTDRKLSIEGRYNSLHFMSNHADIAVSHQWENNLNYLYFDLAWMGWPIIHNASLCKDVGYYYDEFNYEKASEQILKAVYNHDINRTIKYTKCFRRKGISHFEIIQSTASSVPNVRAF
jgi:hypothetical protein